jgi:hypothetical protein
LIRAEIVRWYRRMYLAAPREDTATVETYERRLYPMFEGNGERREFSVKQG